MIIRKNVQKDLFIWKSDVDNTYQNMPICFQCQFSNIIWVKKNFQEDHFSNFGSSVSPTILCFFFFSFGHLSCELVDFSLESSRLIFSWIIIVGYTFHGEFSLFEDIKYLLTRPSFLNSLFSWVFLVPWPSKSSGNYWAYDWPSWNVLSLRILEKTQSSQCSQFLDQLLSTLFDWFLGGRCMGIVWFLFPGSKNFRIDTGLPAALGDILPGSSKSHCRNSNVFKIHTPFSVCLACLLGSNPGLSEGVFGYEKTILFSWNFLVLLIYGQPKKLGGCDVWTQNPEDGNIQVLHWGDQE